MRRWWESVQPPPGRGSPGIGLCREKGEARDADQVKAEWHSAGLVPGGATASLAAARVGSRVPVTKASDTERRAETSRPPQVKSCSATVHIGRAPGERWNARVEMERRPTKEVGNRVAAAKSGKRRG